jgi:hypothetical protein
MKYKLSTVPSIIVLLIVFSVMLILKTQFPEKYPNLLKFNTGLGVTSRNFSNRWQYKFHYLDGTVQGWFTAENDHAKLIYSSNIEKGTIVYRLFGRSDSLIFTLPVSNTADTLMGVFEKGDKYEIRATAKNAKGDFDFRME